MRISMFAVLSLSLSLLLLLLSLSNVAVNGARVLMMPMTVGGHLAEHAAVADGLIKRGHEVYILTDTHYKQPPQLKYLAELKYVHYYSPNATMAQPDVMEEEIRSGIFAQKNEAEMAQSAFKPKLHYDSYSAVTDEKLFAKLKAMKFDFAVCDSLFFAYHIIPFRLGIPFAGLSTQLYTYMLRMHPYSSVLPCMLLHEGNNIQTRFEILKWSAILHSLPEFFVEEEKFIDFLHRKGHTEINSLRDIAMKSAIWLQNQSPYMDCARMSMPNVIYVGGLASRPPKLLSNDLQSLMDNSKQGAIVFSFGSLFSSLPDYALEKFFTALGQIPQQVVWRLSLNDSQKKKFVVPKNVKLLNWLPQSDLLAHPNTKLFLTHCGTNGQAEALYNAVPMIGFPMHADQHYNCFRAKVKGFAECMNVIEFDVDDLVTKIRRVIEVQTYKANVLRMSKLFRMEEPPRDKAARWVEHVIEYGSEHLQTPANKMSIFEFLFLDLIAIAFVAIVFSVIVIYALITCICRCIFSGKPAKQKTS
ncbi:UDP-glucuronosyltransferase 2A1-like [Tubulanus polymorphus]|uniref:UDP-glucuronosyltransferase 2A1-like n=1 Tax=Tubulanus polymorphus TaxID=672921 RepID=UPI003DA1EACA